MKRVVLCEGKDDAHLVATLYENADETYCVKPLHGEDIERDMEAVESDELANFQEPRNPYHLLVKSENNKTNVKRVFVETLSPLVKGDPRAVLFVDLDGGPLENFVTDLDRDIQQRRRARELRIARHEVTVENDDMLAATCAVENPRQRLGTFDLLAFRYRPENVVGIGDSSSVERDELVERLLARDHITDVLETTLLADPG